MLLPEQIKKIKDIDNPATRQRYIKYYQLPEDLRQTIFSEEVARKIGLISQQNNLSEAQLWRFSYLIGLVLLGETPTSEFPKEVQKQCQTNEVQANLLAQAVIKEIFYPVKESLRKIHGLTAGVGASIPAISPTAEIIPAKEMPVSIAVKPAPVPPAPLIKEIAKEMPKPVAPPSLPAAPKKQANPSPRAFPVPQLDNNILDLKNLE